MWVGRIFVHNAYTHYPDKISKKIVEQLEQRLPEKFWQPFYIY